MQRMGSKRHRRIVYSCMAAFAALGMAAVLAGLSEANWEPYPRVSALHREPDYPRVKLLPLDNPWSVQSPGWPNGANAAKEPEEDLVTSSVVPGDIPSMEEVLGEQAHPPEFPTVLGFLGFQSPGAAPPVPLIQAPQAVDNASADPSPAARSQADEQRSIVRMLWDLDERVGRLEQMAQR